MDSLKYTQKYFYILGREQFVKIYDNPTKSIKSKPQRRIRKMRKKVSKDECSKIYPTGLSPRHFFGMANMHKFPTIKNNNV